MGGLAVLFLLVLYLVLTVAAIINVKPLWAKGLVLLTALLVPTADAVYGRYKLKQMCAAEAGLKVYRVVVGVEGFMASTADEYWIKQYGYQFTEAESSSGKYYRFFKQNGQVLREDNVVPKSQYRISSIHIGDTKNIYLRRQLVVDTVQGQVLATDTQIAFNGGWAERFLSQFSDSGGGAVAWCTNVEFDSWKRQIEIITNTLKH